jgi:hypothetical protein
MRGKEKGDFCITQFHGRNFAVSIQAVVGEVPGTGPIVFAAEELGTAPKVFGTAVAGRRN